MDTIHIDRLDPTLQRIAHAAFPSYAGRKFKLRPAPERGIDVRSYWDGGSREYFAFVRTDTMQSVEVPAQSAFDRPIAGAEAVSLPPGVVCVVHSIFCGKDTGLTFLVRADEMAPMLPVPAELTRDEKIVLAATCSYKASYNGRSDLRRFEAKRETGIDNAAWDAAKASCIARGLLNKAGAITVAGKNAIGRVDLWNLRSR